MSTFGVVLILAGIGLPKALPMSARNSLRHRQPLSKLRCKAKAAIRAVCDALILYQFSLFLFGKSKNCLDHVFWQTIADAPLSMA